MILVKQQLVLILILVIAGCAGPRPGTDAAAPAAVKSPPQDIKDAKVVPDAIDDDVTNASTDADSKRLSKSKKEQFIDDVSQLKTQMGKLHGEPVGHESRSGLLLDEVNAAQTVAEAVKRHDRRMNLTILRNYDAQIGKKDLLPLSDAAAVTYLRDLDLNGLLLTDDALDPISHLRLEKLNLGGNKLRTLKAIEGMDSLTFLDVSKSPLDASAFRRIGKFPSLTMLNVANTSLSDQDLNQLTGLKQLQYLVINNSKVTDAGLKSFLKDINHKCDIAAGDQPILDTSMDALEKLIDHQEYDEADTAIKAKLPIWLAKSPTDYASLSYAYALLGRCAVAHHRVAEAGAYYAKSHELFAKSDLAHRALWTRVDRFSEYVNYLASNGKVEEVLKLRLEREAATNSLLSSPYSLSTNWQFGAAHNRALIGRQYLHAGKFLKAARQYEEAAMVLEGLKQRHFLEALSWRIEEGDAFKSAHDMKNSRACYLKAERMIPAAEKIASEKEITQFKNGLAERLSKQ